MKKNILVVAPDAAFRAVLARALLAAGHGVELAEGARRVRELVAARQRIDLGILALGGAEGERLAQELPHLADGLILIADGARPAGGPPLPDAEFLASSDAAAILARVEERLRRRGANGEAGTARLAFEAITIDPAAHAAFDEAGAEIALTRAEFALLLAFARAPGRALSRDQLRLSVTGEDADAYDRSIDVMVWRLRRKVERDPKAPRLILTVPGIGYKFAGQRARSGDAVPRIRAIAAPAPKPAPGGEALPAERRQVTVLVAEFLGLAALSAELDPERLAAVTARLQEKAGALVAQHGGCVARQTAGGLVAHFGDPQTREDDAEKAVRAGLALIAAGRKGEPPLACRIGVASGLVVLGAGMAGGVHSEREAVGEGPALAERLAAAAEPNTLAISASTHRLLRGLFECRARGAAALDGFRDPVPMWQVLRPSGAASRFEARHDIAPEAALLQAEGLGAALPAEGLTPLVGRGRELETLTRLAAASPNRLTAIDILGDPGIGKSRLLHEFRAQLIGDGFFVLAGSCWPDSQETAFRPFIEVVRRAFRIAEEDAAPVAAEKFARALDFFGLAGAQNVGLLMNLLGLEPPRESLAGLDGVLIGLHTRDLLLALLRERSKTRSLAVLLEDLHWIDRASEDLLARLVAAEDAPPLLIIATRRPEYHPPWSGGANVTTLPLEPLSGPDTARIVELRLGARERDDALVRLIAERAEGNPLFAEEIANYLVDQMARRAEGSVDELARLCDSAYAESQGAEDIFLCGSVMMVAALNYASRGLNVEAAVWSRRELEFGRQHGDPRTTANALWLFAWQAMMAGDFATAQHYGEASVDAASSDFDRILGRVAIGTAKLLTGHVAEGRRVIHLARSQAEARGALYVLTATDAPVGVAMVLSGEIKGGIAWLEARIRHAEKEMSTGIGIDYLRMHLAEIYIGLLTSQRRPPLRVLLRQPFAILAARLRAARRAEGLLRKAMENPQFSERGIFHARIAYDLGLVDRAAGRKLAARRQFERARLAAAAQKANALLAKIDAALADL